MTPESITRSTWPNINALIVALEHEIYNLNKTLPSMLTANLAPGEVQRTELELATAQARLDELYALVSFWEEHRGNGKKEIPLITFLAIAISYGVAIVIILIYLALLVGR